MTSIDLLHTDRTKRSTDSHQVIWHLDRSLNHFTKFFKSS